MTKNNLILTIKSAILQHNKDVLEFCEEALIDLDSKNQRKRATLENTIDIIEQRNEAIKNYHSFEALLNARGNTGWYLFYPEKEWYYRYLPYCEEIEESTDTTLLNTIDTSTQAGMNKFNVLRGIQKTSTKLYNQIVTGKKNKWFNI